MKTAKGKVLNGKPYAGNPHVVHSQCYGSTDLFLVKLVVAVLCAVTLSGCINGHSGGTGEPALDAVGVVVNGRTVADVEWRHEPDGVAVRYRLPAGRRVISGEKTAWTLPEDADCWYQVGTGYEEPYSWGKVRDVPKGVALGMPITFRLQDGTYRLITEANLVDYTDLAVVYEGDGRFVARYHAEKGPFEQSGADTTPWRVMIVAKDLNELFNCDLVRRLCPPPTNARSIALAKPGRAVWQWLPAGNPRYEDQKDWYDKTARLGVEYYLIDAGWKNWRDGKLDQWACLEKAIAYGLSIGVKTAIWVHSKELASASERRTYLARVAKSGAVGIKIDFVPPCDSKWCKWYEETLADTAEVGLFVDFHGCVKPTGRERTWPHELAREAIRGHEYHITRYNRILSPEHDTILPFCRLVQGHGDYTPVVFQKDQLIHFTWPRQLAQGVVMACPFLCFGDYPSNYLASPMLEVVKNLPATYDETRVLPCSSIGNCVAMARRKGDRWFIAVENSSQVRKLEIGLSFLGKGTWTLKGFRDDPKGVLDSCVGDERKVSAGDILRVSVNSCGGYIAMATRD